MKYDYDFKDDLIQKLKMNEDFSGCEKLKEFLRAYQIVDDEKKKNLLKFIIYKCCNYHSDYACHIYFYTQF